MSWFHSKLYVRRTTGAIDLSILSYGPQVRQKIGQSWNDHQQVTSQQSTSQADISDVTGSLSMHRRSLRNHILACNHEFNDTNLPEGSPQASLFLQSCYGVTVSGRGHDTLRPLNLWRLARSAH